MPLESVPTNAFLPFLNAILNGLAALFLLIGYICIRRKRVVAHYRAMLTAFAFSTLFLISYLWYHFHYVSNRFGGEGIIRPFYFAMLISHILLAIFIVPFAFRLLWLASRREFTGHARLARIVWPAWMYTSVTGVLIYMMLYHWFPGPPRGMPEVVLPAPQPAQQEVLSP